MPGKGKELLKKKVKNGGIELPDVGTIDLLEPPTKEDLEKHYQDLLKDGYPKEKAIKNKRDLFEAFGYN